MQTTKQIAKQLRDVHFGGNWTWVNLKDTLADVTWQQAVTKVQNLNTIVALVYHINYYIGGVMPYLQGEPLTISDKFAFAHPPIASQEDWDNLLNKVWKEAEELAVLIEQFPEEKLWDVFFQEQYGNYYRNFTGIIEHTHYHLGQIVIIKKVLSEQ